MKSVYDNVATYPSAGGRRKAYECVFQGRKNAWSFHQHLFEENVRKTKSESTSFKK